MAELQEEKQEEFIQPHKAALMLLLLMQVVAMVAVAAVELQVKREATGRRLPENVFK